MAGSFVLCADQIGYTRDISPSNPIWFDGDPNNDLSLGGVYLNVRAYKNQAYLTTQDSDTEESGLWYCENTAAIAGWTSGVIWTLVMSAFDAASDAANWFTAINPESNLSCRFGAIGRNDAGEWCIPLHSKHTSFTDRVGAPGTGAYVGSAGSLSFEQFGAGDAYFTVFPSRLHCVDHDGTNWHVAGTMFFSSRWRGRSAEGGAPWDVTMRYDNGAPSEHEMACVGGSYISAHYGVSSSDIYANIDYAQPVAASSCWPITGLFVGATLHYLHMRNDNKLYQDGIEIADAQTEFDEVGAAGAMADYVVGSDEEIIWVLGDQQAFADANVVVYSPDNGVTWEDKTSNLPDALGGAANWTGWTNDVVGNAIVSTFAVFSSSGIGVGCARELEASQILVPDSGGEYKPYSLLLLMQSLLRATSGTGMAPHHFITQRGPLQDGSSPLDMRWDDGTLQLLIADYQRNRTDYFDKRDALVRLLRPNRSFGWSDGIVRPLIFRKWLPYGRQESGTDLVLTAGSAIVRSNTGRFVERGLDPGCTIDIVGTVFDDGTYTIDDVRNDYTLQLGAAMVGDETGAHWTYMRRWGKRDLHCLLEQGPAFDSGPGPGPFTPHGFSEALRFVANDPFWYGQEQREVWATTALDALVFDTDGTSLIRAWFGETAGVGYWFFGGTFVSENVQVVYWGTVGAKPILTITGPATDPVIDNTTVGVRIEMDYDVAAGETVTIDVLAQTITNNFGTNLQPFTTGDLATFEISPRPQAIDGINDVFVSFGGGVSGESAITMTWRNRYESLH